MKTQISKIKIPKRHFFMIATIPKAFGFEAATRFLSISTEWQPYPNCRISGWGWLSLGCNKYTVLFCNLHFRF